MNHYRWCVLLMILGFGSLSVDAQSVPGYGWSSWGVLPFRGYDFVIVKAPTRYILYYTKHSTTSIAESAADTKGRAFSTDLKNWTVDPSDICFTSGDLGCEAKAGVLNLPDGRLRMFAGGGGGMSSWISLDGVVWTREAGLRLPPPDPSSIYERGQFALALASFVNLADGSVRMYYEGGTSNGSPGTPDYYNSSVVGGVILSALSKDNGLTWVREGVRINPMVHGPATYRGERNLLLATDVSAVATKEDGRTVFRIFAPAEDGAVSYISYDGLTFVLEGQVPANGAGDPKAIVLPDGRIWLISNQYPEAIVDTLVYGPQSLFLSSVKAGVAVSKPFESALMGITGSSTGSVSFEAATDGGTSCPNASDLSPCPFHPEYYSFSPASGIPPFTTVVSYTGPPDYGNYELFVHAKAGDVTAAGAIHCMKFDLSNPGNSVFCKTTEADLPMNKMSFAFSNAAPPSSQTSSILSLGGHGYPFSVSSSVPWATVSPANGTAPMPLAVKVDPAGLAAGTYSGIVTISAEGTTEQITVTTVVSAGTPVITSVRNAASLTATVAPNSFITIFGSGFAQSPVTWSPTTDLPTTLGGVRVRINGKDGYISYADSGQLNVLAPPDTASGTVMVEVTAPSGTTTANVTMVQVAPAWFTYTLGSATWIAALFGNTAIYVAPSGSLGTQASRSAKPGDFLQLYANGLGATNPVAPSGVVLKTAYPLDDLSRVKVTIAGRPVSVLFVGLVFPGLYQVNIQVPSGLGVGELPVVMTVDGQLTQGATLNVQ